MTLAGFVQRLLKEPWLNRLLSFAVRFFRQRLDICITRNSGNLAFSVPINLEALLINYLILLVLVISIIRKPCWFILLISICNLIYWWWLDNAEKERVIKTFERIDTQHIIFLKNTRPNLQLYKVWKMNMAILHLLQTCQTFSYNWVQFLLGQGFFVVAIWRWADWDHDWLTWILLYMIHMIEIVTHINLHWLSQIYIIFGLIPFSLPAPTGRLSLMRREHRRGEKELTRCRQKCSSICSSDVLLGI